MFSATWNKKNLFALHKAWFVNLSARLVSVDLSENHIEELPDELFNTLPLLEILDVSKNKLQYLPEVTSTFTRYCQYNFKTSELDSVYAKEVCQNIITLPQLT